ncbi:cell division transport system permease protein [Litorivivens lipolytica]|uniref:Cell division protein FtsX n=1 Tax=Litorivivens lipolytica TaxID=1524264 RepID=A0A7W4W7D6_9GAMM|nr:permease-like cell division protein FtsX [Litorivivens lipolytica]MBB3048817.1 cell division transport system permease protein [Litorivivens lipolytica]
MSANAARRPVKSKPSEPKTPGTGASVKPIGLREKWQGYWANQRLVAGQTLRRLVKEPASSAMTVLVIGIALALPVVMLVALANIEQLGRGWDGTAKISLFLDQKLSDADAQRFANSLKSQAGVEAVEYRSSREALDEFRVMSGYGDVLNSLSRNPLPAVVLVTPKASEQMAETSRQLLELLVAKPEVAQAKLDLEWVQRLHAMMEIGKRITLALAFLLMLGVLLVIGNTIKLAIEARRDEIVVVKLVGGTNAFVRRPFLYTGFWYGLGGGLTAWVILQASLLILAGPVSTLAGLYESEYSLIGLGFGNTVMLWITSGLLGWMGAFLVVGRHLSGIEPR